MASKTTKDYHKQWSKDNADHLEEYRQTPKYKEQQRLASKRFREKNPESNMLRSVKQSARIKKLECNIDKTDIIIPDVCPVLGIPLFKNGKLTANTPSIDRIKPELGYVKGNILVVSLLANRIKTNATAAQIFAVGKFYLELEEKNV
jgi:hypothetical protein